MPLLDYSMCSGEAIPAMAASAVLHSQDVVDEKLDEIEDLREFELIYAAVQSNDKEAYPQEQK